MSLNPSTTTLASIHQQTTKLQSWESRSTLAESITGLGTRLTRILSSSSAAVPLSSTLASMQRQNTDSDANSAAPDNHSRSQSRGREVFHSSGRGGAGNIRPTSSSRGPEPSSRDGPDDYSQTRGREINVTPAITHTGRGGAGNIRSPSREPPPASPSQAERDIVKQHAEYERDLPHSSGRGGAGNIVGSKSRSRSGVRSSGRGGAGNMISPTSTDTKDLAMIDEIERAKHHHYAEGIHSTGRGGMANFTTSPPPGIDLPPIHESLDGVVISSGRGGAGNIRQASHSRTRGG